MGKPGGNGSRPLLHIRSFAEITGQRQKKREDEQVGWQLIPTTIAHPIPRRIHQPALKNRRREDGQVGWQLIPTTIAHLIPRRAFSVAIAMPNEKL